MISGEIEDYSLKFAYISKIRRRSLKQSRILTDAFNKLNKLTYENEDHIILSVSLISNSITRSSACF